MSMCFGIGIVDVNGLVCMKIERLRHEFNMLKQ